MRIAICYICVSNGRVTDEFASRFVSSYLLNPGGVEHDFIVLCNNGPPPRYTGMIFSPVESAKFYPRSNDGWDIAAYLEAAHGPAKDYDMMLCFGESVYFTRPLWLRRIVDCWNQFGPGMYGFFSSFVTRAHMNTTAFVTSPELLRRYPNNVVSRQDRYEFEHGINSYWRRCRGIGKPAKLITWDGCWDPLDWRKPNNILWRGDQSNMLIRCNHADGYDAADPNTKLIWSMKSDQKFK